MHPRFPDSRAVRPAVAVAVALVVLSGCLGSESPGPKSSPAKTQSVPGEPVVREARPNTETLLRALRENDVAVPEPVPDGDTLLKLRDENHVLLWTWSFHLAPARLTLRVEERGVGPSSEPVVREVLVTDTGTTADGLVSFWLVPEGAGRSTLKYRLKTVGENLGATNEGDVEVGPWADPHARHTFEVNTNEGPETLGPEELTLLSFEAPAPGKDPADTKGESFKLSLIITTRAEESRGEPR